MTPDQYRQNVIDRFGCISRADLAKLENAAMKARLQTSNGAQATMRKSIAVPAPDPGVSMHHDAILRILSKGEATAGDIAHRLNIARDTAGEHLRKLLAAGIITGSYVKQMRVYSRKEAE